MRSVIHFNVITTFGSSSKNIMHQTLKFLISFIFLQYPYFNKKEKDIYIYIRISNRYTLLHKKFIYPHCTVVQNRHREERNMKYCSWVPVDNGETIKLLIFFFFFSHPALAADDILFFPGNAHICFLLLDALVRNLMNSIRRVFVWGANYCVHLQCLAVMQKKIKQFSQPPPLPPPPFFSFIKVCFKIKVLYMYGRKKKKKY